MCAYDSVFSDAVKIVLFHRQKHHWSSLVPQNIHTYNTHACMHAQPHTNIANTNYERNTLHLALLQFYPRLLLLTDLVYLFFLNSNYWRSQVWYKNRKRVVQQHCLELSFCSILCMEPSGWSYPKRDSTAIKHDWDEEKISPGSLNPGSYQR